MPTSEAHFDAPGDLLEVTLPAYTGHLGGSPGVDLVDGKAQGGCAPATAHRIASCLGPAFRIVGPWPPVPPPTDPAPSLAPSSGDGAGAPPPAPSAGAQAPAVDTAPPSEPAPPRPALTRDQRRENGKRKALGLPPLYE